jgi:hypothetical protein
MFWQERTPGIDQPSSDQDCLQSRPVKLKEQSNKNCNQLPCVLEYKKTVVTYDDRATPRNKTESDFQTRIFQTVTKHIYKKLKITAINYLDTILQNIVPISVPDRIRIHRIHRILGLPDPDPLVRGIYPDLASDPDPSIIKQK